MKINKLVKILSLALSLTLFFSVLTGCSSQKDSVTIKVGVCAGPYEDMFKEAIEPTLKEKGYTVEYVQFSDYVQPNKALAEGEINVNIFQHSVYLENFKQEHNLDLVYVTEIPTAGMGIFANNINSIDDVPSGAKVAIPNDATNLARAIRVLEQTGLVKIDPSVDPAEATQNTLSENPKNLTFVEIEAPQLPRSLESVDLAVINGNYALSAGLNLSDALYNEELQEGYVNVIAVRTENKDAQFTKDIVSTVHSDAFRSVIDDASKQYSSFFKPKDYNN
ncbi:MAG TPA: metal ABC transporter substrate-binding protein [Ruminococcaceae bacterium]|nr:metal ABC transporter substrate-binding protein [Oscillospiraceae bacterium]